MLALIDKIKNVHSVTSHCRYIFFLSKPKRKGYYYFSPTILSWNPLMEWRQLADVTSIHQLTGSRPDTTRVTWLSPFIAFKSLLRNIWETGDLGCASFRYGLPAAHGAWFSPFQCWQNEADVCTDLYFITHPIVSPLNTYHHYLAFIVCVCVFLFPRCNNPANDNDVTAHVFPLRCAGRAWGDVPFLMITLWISAQKVNAKARRRSC